MGQLKLDGAFVGGPASVSDGGPTATLSAQLRLQQSPKTFVDASGVLVQSLNSAGSFKVLPCVGADGPVMHADTLYLRSDSNIELRLTLDDGVGGNNVITIPMIGTILLEFQQTKFLKLLEAKGVALLEYFACGQT